MLPNMVTLTLWSFPIQSLNFRTGCGSQFGMDGFFSNVKFSSTDLSMLNYH